MPFLNRQNNEDLILALQTAGDSRGRNGFRKDKGGGETRRNRGRPAPAPHRRHRRFRHPLYRLRQIPTKLQFPLELYGRGINLFQRHKPTL